MLSNFVKFILTASAFSPFLLVYWIVTVIQEAQKYTLPKNDTFVCVITDSLRLVLLPTITSLLIFLCFILLLVWMIRWAKDKLTIHSIVIDSIESSDSGNIVPILIGYFLPALNLFSDIGKHRMYMWGMLFIYILVILVNKNSYSHNPVLWVFGYRHYKVKTSAGVTLILLSKAKIINKKDVTKYVHLTDYLLLNMSN